MVAGDEEDGEQRQLQGLQVDGMASPERGGGPGSVALAWDGLEPLVEKGTNVKHISAGLNLSRQ